MDPGWGNGVSKVADTKSVAPKKQVENVNFQEIFRVEPENKYHQYWIWSKKMLLSLLVKPKSIFNLCIYIKYWTIDDVKWYLARF